jgi:hypothetical protein
MGVRAALSIIDTQLMHVLGDTIFIVRLSVVMLRVVVVSVAAPILTADLFRLLHAAPTNANG